MFENRALRKIFVPKREEVLGDWKKIGKEIKQRNEKLYDLKSSNNFPMINSRKKR